MPKKKGDKGGNPNPPQPPEFIAAKIARTINDPYKDIPLSKNVQIRLHVPVVEALDLMDSKERVNWLRLVITKAAIEQLGVEMFKETH